MRLDHIDLAVAIGGDGTLLRVASALYPQEVPILGVNVGGSLGFLSACGPEGMVDCLEGFLRGELRVEPRLRLSVRFRREERTALNDVVFTGAGSYRFTELEVVDEDGPVMRFAGDGLVVSTPTGSTAYALACGGPILHPCLEAILLVPLSPHTLRLRPLLLPRGASLRVKALYGATIFVDGDRLAPMKAGEVAEVEVAPARTLLLRPKGGGFPERLKEAFGWEL